MSNLHNAIMHVYSIANKHLLRVQILFEINSDDQNLDVIMKKKYFCHNVIKSNQHKQPKNINMYLDTPRTNNVISIIYSTTCKYSFSLLFLFSYQHFSTHTDTSNQLHSPCDCSCTAPTTPSHPNPTFSFLPFRLLYF